MLDSSVGVSNISAVTLKRTDTTLDLSLVAKRAKERKEKRGTKGGQGSDLYSCMRIRVMEGGVSHGG